MRGDDIRILPGTHAAVLRAAVVGMALADLACGSRPRPLSDPHPAPLRIEARVEHLESTEAWRITSRISEPMRTVERVLARVAAAGRCRTLPAGAAPRAVGGIEIDKGGAAA
jgi:hypothetical protein